MQSYMFIPGVHIKPKEVSYGEAPFKNFIVREVFIDGKQSGEYHVKLQNASHENIQFTNKFFSNVLNECEVGIIDPTNTLNLEYHLYVKTADQMKILSMIQIMECIDDDLVEILKTINERKG